MTRNPFSSDWLSADSDERLRPQRGLSYVAGPRDDPLRFITIPQLLDETVAAHGARDAAVFAATGTRWSWYDLQRKADEVAAGLLALGIKRGDRVGIWAPNCEEWLGLQFGTARIGAILVNINPAYRESELEYALNKVQCRVLVMARALKSSDYVAILRALAPEIDRAPADGRLRCERLPRLRHVVLMDDWRSAGRRHELQGVPASGRTGAEVAARLRCRRHSIPTTPSTSSSRAARPGRPRAPR